MSIEYKIMINKGSHLVGIGKHVQVWKYNKYCIVFEDEEKLGVFLRQGKDDWNLIERSIVFYRKHISSARTKH